MTTTVDEGHRPTFTIIVPTYNEAADIGTTCDALLALQPQPDEIIFVDDASSDDTRNVIGRYLLRDSIHLIERPINHGVATTRNVGARVAKGDIVVFLNADVRLPSNFLLRLTPHYERGADYVAVESAVINTDSVYGRFLEAQHQHLHGSTPQLGWTEGFSCRRALALQAGLFAEALPGAGGEDGEFVERLSALTHRGVTDRTIVVPHIVPATMIDFWRQWTSRGVAVPFLRHHVHHLAWPRLIAERIAASTWSLLLGLLAVPALVRGIKLARRSRRRCADLPSFVALTVLQQCAHRTGEWRGVLRLYWPDASDAH